MKQYSKISINDLGGTLNEIVAPGELPTKDVIECVNWRVHKDGRSREKRPGYSKLKEIDGNPPIIQIHEYKDANNINKTIIITPHEIIAKKDVAGYEKKWEGAYNWKYQTLIVYNNKLLRFDYIGTGVSGAYVSNDGITWEQLFTYNVAPGTYNFGGATVFNNEIWFGIYGDNQIARWDGNDVTEYNLVNDAYLITNLIVWDGKLWTITESGTKEARKVFYWNGVSWVTISNYDNDSEILWNKSSYLPKLYVKERLTRFLEFNGELYIIATTFDPDINKYKWNVWKFDRTTYNKFTKIFDSKDLDNQEIFITDYNNKLDFDEGGGELTAIIPNGKYNLSDLCSEIKSQMEAVGNNTYTVTYNDSTDKITIAGSSSFSLLWRNGTNMEESIGRALGFNMGFDDTGSASYTGDWAVRGFCSVGAIFFKGKVYVFGNDVETDMDYYGGIGELGRTTRIYSSADMVNWQIENTIASVGGVSSLKIFDDRLYVQTKSWWRYPTGYDTIRMYFYDRIQKNLVLEQDIITYPIGEILAGMCVYNNELWVIKYKEIYKRVVTTNEWSDIFYTENEIVEPPPKVVFDDRLLVGGNQDSLAIEGESTHKLGIEAPETAPSVATGGAGNLTGDYQYVVTFYRSGNYPCESNPSPASDVVSPSGQKVNLTDIPISPDPKVNARRIYRTTAGGAIFYWLVDINDNATTTFEDNYHDDELGDEVSYDRYPPPQGKYYEVWDNRLWIAGNKEYPNMLYFTNTGTAEEMASTNFLAIKRRESDVITQIKAFGDYLYIWKKKSWFRIEKIGDSLYEVVQRPEKIGCDASHSVAICNKLLIWKSKYGIEVFNGDSIFRPILSKVIQRTIDSINKNYLYKCIGGHNPVDGEYWLSIPTGTDTDPTKVIVLDYLKGYFTIYEFAKGISSFYPTTDANGDLVTLVGTPDGFIYVMGDGYTDDGEVINAHFKTGWIPIADEPYIWSVLRRIFVRYILPANKTITMKVYKNFEKTPILTKTLGGATPTDNVELRNEIMKRVDARVAGYYIQLEFINNEDVGGECRITGVDLFFRKKLPKHSVEAD